MIGARSGVGPTTQVPRPRPPRLPASEDGPDRADTLLAAQAGPPEDATPPAGLDRHPVTPFDPVEPDRPLPGAPAPSAVPPAFQRAGTDTPPPDRERGALLFEDTPATGLVPAASGNDGYLLDRRVGREVEFVRQRLTAAGAQEQGSGLSRDGRSWALLVRVGDPGYRTRAGRAFYAEMARIEVEEEVGRAREAACGADAGGGGGAGCRAG